jgi:micrococcal nuclease
VTKAAPAKAPAKKAAKKAVKAAKAPEKAAAKAAKAAKKTAKATKKAAAKKTTKAVRGWVEPQGQVCPLSHPIKARLETGLYYLPGMANYTRTRPDRCYGSEAQAKRDGLTAARR